MILLRELVALTRRTLVVWGRTWAQMTFWCATGLTLHMLALFASAVLGKYSQPLAIAVFILGVLCLMASLILMLLSGRPALRSPAALAARHNPGVPDTVFRQSGPLEVLLAALGPFMVVYSVWGLVEDEIARLFGVNLIIHGSTTKQWSIGFDRWQLYLGLALGLFLLKQLLQVLERRPGARQRLIAAAILACEGGWIFLFFVVLNQITTRIETWVLTRRAWVALAEGWYGFVAALPDWRLPFGLLPEVVRDAGAWLAEEALPALGSYVALPLFWLALTAVVHGWRDFSVRGVLTGRTAHHLARLERGPLAFLTADLRDKYLPVLASLRLILRAGGHFLAAYLILAAGLQFLQAWLGRGLLLLEDPTNEPLAIATNHLSDGATQLLTTPLLLSLFLAAFDRAMLGTARRASEPDLVHGGRVRARDGGDRAQTVVGH